MDRCRSYRLVQLSLRVLHTECIYYMSDLGHMHVGSDSHYIWSFAPDTVGLTQVLHALFPQ